MTDIKKLIQIVNESDSKPGNNDNDPTAVLVSAVQSLIDNKITAEQFQQQANDLAEKLADQQNISFESAKQLVDDFVDQYTNLNEAQLNEFLPAVAGAAGLGTLARIGIGSAIKQGAKQIGRGLAVDAAAGAVLGSDDDATANTNIKSAGGAQVKSKVTPITPVSAPTVGSNSSSITSDPIDSSPTLAPALVTKKTVSKPVKKLGKKIMSKSTSTTNKSLAVPVKEWGAAHPRKPKVTTTQLELPFTGSENTRVVYYIYDEKDKKIVADNLPDSETAVATRNRTKANNNYLSVRHKLVPIDRTSESVVAPQSKKWLVQLDLANGTKKKIITTAPSSDEAEEKTIRWARKKNMGVVSFAYATPHLEEVQQSVNEDDDGISVVDLSEILFNRLIARYPDVVTTYGHEAVNDAIQPVAEFHAGVTELGTSDIGIMLREILRKLKLSSHTNESLVHEGQMRLNKDNQVLAHSDRSAKFAQLYIKAMRGDYRQSGPTYLDQRNAERFSTVWTSQQTRRGFAGSGTTIYTNRNTGEQFEVDRTPSGTGFYGTTHTIREIGSDSVQTESRDYRFSVLDHDYTYEVEHEDDNRKIWHYATDPSGQTTIIDFSPYDHMSVDTFKKWIKLGKPKRQDSGPLNKKQIDYMYAEKFGIAEAVNVKQIKKDLDSGMSYDAVIGKHANKKLTNTGEIRKVIQQHAWENRAKKPNTNQTNEAISRTITNDMITRLKAEWNKADTIDPASNNYKKLINLLDKMDQKQLVTLAKAKIKFLSALAARRVKNPSDQQEKSVEEDFQSDFLATVNSPGYKAWKLERDIESGRVPDPNFKFVPPVSEPYGAAALGKTNVTPANRSNTQPMSTVSPNGAKYKVK